MQLICPLEKLDEYVTNFVKDTLATGLIPPSTLPSYGGVLLTPDGQVVPIIADLMIQANQKLDNE